MDREWEIEEKRIAEVRQKYGEMGDKIMKPSVTAQGVRFSGLDLH